MSFENQLAGHRTYLPAFCAAAAAPRRLGRRRREAAALMIAREDRALGLADRWALYFHLLACKACPTFERQVLPMRNALRQWRNCTEN